MKCSASLCARVFRQQLIRSRSNTLFTTQTRVKSTECSHSHRSFLSSNPPPGRQPCYAMEHKETEVDEMASKQEDKDARPIFTYNDQDFVSDIGWPNGNCDSSTRSKFDTALRHGWTDKMSQGVFRYHLGELETRMVPGPRRFVAQLNIMRGKERRKPQEILSIRQEFDPKLFNFNKISTREVLFDMRKQDCHVDEGYAHNGVIDQNCKVIVNVSPLEFGHCLLVPEPTHCHPQVLTPLAIQFGLESVLLSADPGYRVGFNSLGAFASVNHLHLHGYYLNHELGIEHASSEPLIPDKNLYCLHDHAAFLFYTEGQDIGKTVNSVWQLADLLVRENIAHNLFITRGCSPNREGKSTSLRHGVRILLWPRVSSFGAKEEAAFNVALCELAGHLPFKNREDFDSLTEKEIVAIVQRYLLPDEEFLQLQCRVIELHKGDKAQSIA